MAANTHRGDVALVIGGATFTLRYDWDALARLQSAFGHDYDKVLGAAAAKLDVAVLSEFLAAGLQAHHRGITADKVRELAPPLIPVIAAMGRAYQLAIYGEEMPPTSSAVAPGAEAPATHPPANRKARRAMRSQARGGRPSGGASGRRNSGG